MTASESQIVVYQPNETIRLEVRLENETVWLTQLKITKLFGVQKVAISKHVRNIFASGELVRDATVSARMVRSSKTNPSTSAVGELEMNSVESVS